MAEPTARAPRTLNARIEPTIWLEHEAYIRENHGRMDLDSLLRNLQANGLPARQVQASLFPTLTLVLNVVHSKHQLTHQLSKWGLRKYRSRRETVADEIRPVWPTSQEKEPATDRNSSNEMVTSFIPILPNLEMADPKVAEALWQMHERTCFPFEFRNDSFLTPTIKTPLEKAETIIFGIPNDAAWKSLSKINLNSAAVVSACDWFCGQQLTNDLSNDALSWTCSSVSLLGCPYADWFVIMLITQEKDDRSTIKEEMENLSDLPDWLMVFIGNPDFLTHLAELERIWRLYTDSRPEFRSAPTSASLDAYLCYYTDIGQSFRFRVERFWSEDSEDLMWEVNMNTTPMLPIRDQKLELELQGLLSNLIEVSDYITDVEFNSHPNKPWVKLTPFEVLSIAINIYYLRRYISDGRSYNITPTAEKERLKTFRGNVLKLLIHFNQYDQIWNDKRGGIDFGHLILNIDMDMEYSSCDDVLTGRTENTGNVHWSFESPSRRSTSPKVVSSSVLQAWGPITIKETCESGNRRSVSESSTARAVPASIKYLDASQLTASQSQLADTEHLASDQDLGSSLAREIETQRSLNIGECSPMYADKQNNLEPHRDAPTNTGLTRISSLDDCSSDEPNLRNVTTCLEETSAQMNIRKRRYRVSAPSSVSSRSGQRLIKRGKPTEIIDRTLTSGIVVTQNQHAVQRETARCSLPELTAFFSFTQTSDDGSMREMRNLQRLHDAKAFRIGSSLSLPTTESSNSPTFKSLFYGSISSNSALHRHRPKKPRRSTDSREDDGVSNRFSLPFRFT